MVQSLARQLHELLHKPLKVFWFCLTFVLVSLSLNGAFLQLYRLHRDQATLVEQINTVKSDVFNLDKQLQMAKDPAYIERQAMDRYEMVDEHDLVFMFSEE